MKRISFKDSEGLNLTQAVLSGRKTMTRRNSGVYKVGDVVAIQQTYRAVDAHRNMGNALREQLMHTAAWDNKMFVKAEYIPHHIRITDVKVERLQDISDKDCMREGCLFSEGHASHYGIPEYPHAGFFYYDTPREAFAALIDKVSGRGTWNRNPLVWCYSFELVD